MRLLRNLFVLLPILALCFAPCAFGGVVFDTDLQASASNPAPAGSTGLGPGGAVGGVGGPFTFNAPFAGTLVMTVTDCCLVGDVYQAFVDGASLGFTSGVPIGGATLSSGVFTVPLTAGSHTYDINDQILSYLGDPSPYGGDVPTSFSPAGLHVTGDLVSPEPGSMLLLGVGLFGLAAFARKLRKA